MNLIGLKARLWRSSGFQWAASMCAPFPSRPGVIEQEIASKIPVAQARRRLHLPLDHSVPDSVSCRSICG